MLTHSKVQSNKKDQDQRKKLSVVALQERLRDRKLVNIDGRRTRDGARCLWAAYQNMTANGMIVRSNRICFDNNHVKKYEGYCSVIRPVTKEVIKYESDYQPQYDNSGCLHIYTGGLHGGFIGIDIDTKGSKNGPIGSKKNLSGNHTYWKFIDKIMTDSNMEKIRTRAYTLTCKTPNGGYHYVYQLSEAQQDIIKDKCHSPQLELFGCDIDVIYNRGRFVMCGAYIEKCQMMDPEICKKIKSEVLKNCTIIHPDVLFEEINKIVNPQTLKIVNSEVQKIYTIIDDSRPIILPDVLFEEICNKIWTQKIPKIMNKAINCDTEIECELEDDLNMHGDIKIPKITSDEPDIKSEFQFDPRDRDYVFELLKILKPERCDYYLDWFRIGAIMHRYGCTIEDFDKWSSQSNKYKGFDNCNKQWKAYKIDRDDGLKLGTLVLMAQEDNHDAWKKIKKAPKKKEAPKSDSYQVVNTYDLNENDIKKIQTLCTNLYVVGKMTHYKFAVIFNAMYPNKYMYDPALKISMWYTYDKYGKIKMTPGMEEASLIMSNQFYKLIAHDYLIRQNEYFNKISSISDSDVIKKLMKIFERHMATIDDMLGNNYNKTKIIEELRILCVYKDITLKLDKPNPYIIGFENGVYDVRNRVFRNALPEELAFSSVGYDYHEPDPKVKKYLHKKFDQIHPVKAEKDYVLTIYSSVLTKDLMGQKFFMFYGCGANGKTIALILVRSTMGMRGSGIFGYCADVSFALFTGKLSQTEESAQKSACNGAHIISCVEGDGQSDANVLLIKIMSGGDKMTAKFLHTNPITFDITGHLIFVTNECLKYEVKTEAEARRAEKITYRTLFKTKEEFDETNPTHCLADLDFELRCKRNMEYRYAFFSILCDYYTEYVNNGSKLITPAAFLSETKEFLKDSDPIGSFVDAFFDIVDDHKKRIRTSAVNQLFKTFNKNDRITDQKMKAALLKKNNKGIFIKHIKDSDTYYTNIVLKKYELIKQHTDAITINELIARGLLVYPKVPVENNHGQYTCDADVEMLDID